MTSDVLLTGWRPEFEYELQLLCDGVAELQEEEERIEQMDRDFAEEVAAAAAAAP